jgi:hypothetical protein
MALSKDHILQLQSSSKARRLFALEFSKAYAAMHRSFPHRSNFEDDASYNDAAQKYNSEIGVKSKLEQAINEQGVLSIFACNMLLSALSTYENLNSAAETEDGIIDRVLGYEEDGVNIMFLECTKLLKGWSFSAQII